MSKLWTIGSRLLVLGMVFLIVSVVGHLVAIGCLLWWPGMVQVVLKCSVCALIFAIGLIVAALVLADILEKKINESLRESMQKGE